MSLRASPGATEKTWNSAMTSEDAPTRRPAHEFGRAAHRQAEGLSRGPLPRQSAAWIISSTRAVRVERFLEQLARFIDDVDSKVAEVRAFLEDPDLPSNLENPRGGEPDA